MFPLKNLFSRKADMIPNTNPDQKSILQIVVRDPSGRVVRATDVDAVIASDGRRNVSQRDMMPAGS